MRFVNCLWLYNSAENSGGAIYLSSSGPNIWSNTFSSNASTGIEYYCGGGAIYGHHCSSVIRNCIAWNNEAIRGSEIMARQGDGSEVMDVDFCDVKDGYEGIYVENHPFAWGSHNITEPPLFAGKSYTPYALNKFSPCVNRGSNDHSSIVDIEGNPRPFMGTVDMGAYEYMGIHLFEADTFGLSVCGGSIDLALHGGSQNASRDYLILGSLSGSIQGTPLPGGAILPVNWDMFTELMLGLLGSSVFDQFLGSLDAAGEATAHLNIPAIDPSAIGIGMTYAYCMKPPLQWEASNPLVITLVP